MNALQAIERELVQTGYAPDAVLRDYSFADVLSVEPQQRSTRLAAFTHTPPSYRSAALAVVGLENRDPFDVVADYRALGAPLLFLIQDDEVSVWQVRLSAPPRSITRVSASELPQLFEQYRKDWNPQAIHRAKSLGQIESSYQLDFVDVGLLPAIESEVHNKLDHLLTEILSQVHTLIRQEKRVILDDRALFRIAFRLLSAKVLLDRGHDLTRQWDARNIDSVVGAISDYYGLPKLSLSSKTREIASQMWMRLCEGISFRNISADDLAFVYENTLVTPETRKHFGTHSTPRQATEYIVSRLGLQHHEVADLRIYEPFAGAGIFLVSALRHLKDLLPMDWNDRQRHDFLVERLAGDELDAFACEVAALSLILADYPNANGWRIHEVDLFEDDRIAERAKKFNVVLCNPPFEAFSPEERVAYPQAAARSLLKPAAVLNTILDAAPLAIGFVLPHSFILDRRYGQERRRIEALYRNIELVSLPDRTFKVSKTESALLIAHDRRRSKSDTKTFLRSSVVADRDRERFLRSGHVTESRSLTRVYSEKNTDRLWIGELHDLWQRLKEGQTRLGDLVSIHVGIKWNYSQSDAVSLTRKPGFALGLHNAKSIRQFFVGDPVWLDCQPEQLHRAANLTWASAKIVANAVRLSRGPWRIAAAVETKGLVCSQQFFGLWPKQECEIDLHVLCAVLNGPLANAYLAVHSPAKGIRIHVLNDLPVPTAFPNQLSELVRTYSALVSERNELTSPQKQQETQELLNQIDALVLKAYDLPPRLEKALLEFFRDSKRPVLHPWKHWLPEGFNPFIPLHEYYSPAYKKLTGHWPLEVFEPLPEEEAQLLWEYLD